MKKIFCLTLFIFLCAAAGFAATDGSVDFSVTTSSTGDRYETRHIIAIWVTDSSGGFVKTLMEFSGTRRTYLNEWQADSDPDFDTTGVPDVLSGATINGHRTHTVTWDCRDRSGNIVADGNYNIRVEMTAKNGSGPIKTITFTKGTSPVSLSPSSHTYNNRTVFSGMSLVYTPATIPHNIAVSTPSAPASLFIGESTPVTVTVSNLTSTTETGISVVLRDDTTSTTIDTQTITSLSGNATQPLSFSWNTTGLTAGTHTLRISAGPVPDETSTIDNSRTASALLKTPVHDLTVGPFNSTWMLRSPDTTDTISLSVTNTGAYTESFAVVLEDFTEQTLIGSNAVSSLASGSDTSVSFSWDTAGNSMGYHLLRAIAGPVAGETSTEDNIREISVPVAEGVQPQTILPRESVWKYQDSGLNLHQSKWNTTTYYDDWWGSGPGPLGYGNSNLNTTVSYGPEATDKYPCTYFRKKLLLTAIPTLGQIRVQRDDGVVVYINGKEVVRDNMPAGEITFQTYAADSAATIEEETTYRAYALPAGYLQIGLNVIGAEVHQASGASSDIQFDLEISGLVPTFPEVRDLAVTQITPPSSILVGDQVDIAVRAANLGSKTETAQITLSDDASGSIGSASTDELLPGESETVLIAWNTLGAATGAHALSAEITALSGETNLTNNTLTAPANISSAGWISRTPGADGSIGGFCSAVTLSGSVACIGEGPTLTVLDISTPSSPQRLGSLLLDGRIEDLTIVGSMAIAACGQRGVQFIDISNTASPVYIKTFDSSGHAWRVVVDGTRLYVADGVGGLRIFDVTNPTSPTLLGGYATEGAARSVTVSGATAYLLDSRNGLLILNVSDAANPLLIGEYDGISAGADLALNGDFVYVVGDLARFTTIDISNPAAPVLQSQLNLSGPARALSMSGSLVIVAVENQGTHAVNISDPATPVVSVLSSSKGQALDLVLTSGRVVYLADGDAGLVMRFFASGTYAQNTRARQSVEQDDLLYVAAGTSGVNIYTATNPAAPSLEGALSAASNACGVAISPHALYVADGQYGLLLGDLAVPNAPAAQGRFTSATLGTIHSVACSGDQAVITDGSSVALINASTLTTPAETARYETTGSYLYDVDMNSNLVAVAAGSDGALVLNRNSLVLLAAVPANEPVTDVSLDGSTLWLAAGSSWIAADVSTPASPSVLATHTGQNTRTLAADNGRVVVQKQQPAGTLFDVSTPLTPVELDSVPALAEVLNLSISGRYILASQDDAGLGFFLTTESDQDEDGLLDSWEQTIVDANSGDAITSIEDVLPGDDFDGDGLSNLAEWIAGTDPTDPSSVFALIPPEPAEGGFPLRWHSVAGKTYTVHVSTNLTEGFTVYRSGINASGPITEEVVSDQESQSFFVITVE